MLVSVLLEADTRNGIKCARVVLGEMPEWKEIVRELEKAQGDIKPQCECHLWRRVDEEAEWEGPRVLCSLRHIHQSHWGWLTRTPCLSIELNHWWGATHGSHDLNENWGDRNQNAAAGSLGHLPSHVEGGLWNTFSWLSHSHKGIPKLGGLGLVKQCHNLIREPSSWVLLPHPPQHAPFFSWSEMTNWSVAIISELQKIGGKGWRGHPSPFEDILFWRSYTALCNLPLDSIVINPTQLQKRLRKCILYSRQPRVWLKIEVSFTKKEWEKRYEHTSNSFCHQEAEKYSQHG